MKKQLLIAIGFLTFTLNASATQHVIFNIPGNAYSTPYLQVNLGDTVIFATTMTHTTQEVSFATWSINDTTHLVGGFDGVPGSSTFIATTLGDIYYVCIEHVQMDAMKGQIKVSQLGIDDHKSITMQILQSVSEQYIKLLVSGNATGAIQVEMLNLSGQVVKTIHMELNGDESFATIQVSDMPKGVYMIRWSYGNVNKAKKIILQ